MAHSSSAVVMRKRSPRSVLWPHISWKRGRTMWNEKCMLAELYFSISFFFFFIFLFLHKQCCVGLRGGRIEWKLPARSFQAIERWWCLLELIRYDWVICKMQNNTDKVEIMFKADLQTCNGERALAVDLDVLQTLNSKTLVFIVHSLYFLSHFVLWKLFW